MAAAALRLGDAAPARAMLGGWRVASAPELLDGCLLRLAGAELRPTPRAWAMTMTAAPDRSLPLPSDWRQRVHDGADPDGDVGDPLAWALVELATVGALVDATLRRPWRAERFVEDAVADTELGRLWGAWADRSIFLERRAWEDATLPVMMRAFSAVLWGRRVPDRRRQIAVDDAREGCFFHLLGADEGSASWRELAVRVIESAGPGPVEALAAALPASAHHKVATCAVSRGYGPATARLVWGPDSDTLVQSRELARQLDAQPERLGAMLDVHLLTRLGDRWATPACTAPTRTWNVITNNRGRARARLRAVLRDAPADWLVAQVRALPGLAARTRRAAARFGRDWAWQALQNGLTFDDGRILDPACQAADDRVVAYTDADRARIRAWVLSVVLKGRLRHLLAWTYREDRGAVDLKDATWGRLLKDEIPADLRSAGRGAPPSAGLRRLRAELLDLLPDALAELLPVVSAVAALDFRPRSTRPLFVAAIAPAVHPDVPAPHKQIRKYIAHASDATEAIAAFVARSAESG